MGPGFARPSPVIGKTPCRKRGLLFTRVLLFRDGLRGSGAVGCWCAVGRGWLAAGGGGICSAGPSTRATATAQTLKAGILLVGSRASASVSALALDPPPQWNGAKTTSGLIVSVTCAWNRARPRRVVSSTTSSAPTPSRRARSGCSSARGGGATNWGVRGRRGWGAPAEWGVAPPGGGTDGGGGGGG